MRSDIPPELEKYRDMDPITMMLTMRRDLEYAMPPIGLTEHTATFGGYKWVRQTWRCDQPGCWYVCTPRVGDPTSIESLIEHHKKKLDKEYSCPTPPRRESLPSGQSEIEKLWREIDDVVDAIKSKVPYRGMEGAGLNGYVKGLAFSIVTKDKDFWPDMKAVANQALKRWRMRNKMIPWEATPTRHENNFNSLGGQGGWKKIEQVAPPAPAKKAAPRKAAAVARPSFSPTGDQLLSMRAGLGSGMFTESDFASMYGTTVAEVKRVLAG